MSPRLAAAVEDKLASPTAGKEVTLIIGVNSDARGVRERLAEVGGNIVEELPYDSIVVSVEEPDLDSICSVEGVETIEIEKEYRTRGGKDFLYP